MPRNSSGSYVLPAGNPVVADTLIKTSWANPTMADIAAALTDSLDRYGRGGMLSEFKVADGTVQAPGLAFVAQSNLGLYREGPNVLGIAAGGIAAAKFTNAGVQLLKPVSAPATMLSGQLTVIDGTLAAPAMIFASDADSGFYSPAPGVVAVVTQGVERMRWDAQGNITNSVPIGTILDFAGATAPAGYLLCNGQAVSRTQYAKLFEAIGTTWGAGDGSTTFNVPDLSRRVTIGSGGSVSSGPGNALGNVGGSETQALTVANLPVHAHAISDPTHSHNVYDPGHNHTVRDPQHQHSVYDPPHNHANGGYTRLLRPPYGGSLTGNDTQGSGSEQAVGPGDSADIISAVSGVQIYAAGTGIYLDAAASQTSIYANGTGISVQNTGSGNAHNNMQPSAVVNKIIKV